MATPDHEFIDGFDKYGPIAALYPPLNTEMLGSEWTGVSPNGYFIVSDSLAFGGTSLKLIHEGNSTEEQGYYKSLPGNYARSIGGVTIMWEGDSREVASYRCCIGFWSGVGSQTTIGINLLGQIVVMRGNPQNSPVVLATSVEVVAMETPCCIEWDITFNNTTGSVAIYLNGVLTSINLTDVDNCAQADNSYNRFRLFGYNSGSYPIGHYFDHLYLWSYLVSGGPDTPCLTNPIIETQKASSDSTVAFTPGKAIIGDPYYTSANPTSLSGPIITISSNSVAANSLFLRKFIAPVGGTLTEIRISSAAQLSQAKLKGVVYSDNGSGSAPNTLLSTGTEVVGINGNQSLPLSTPPTVVAGTIYWIGWITDTAINIRNSELLTNGYRAANTYTSGAPVTAPAMTAGQNSAMIYGVITSTGPNSGSLGIDVYNDNTYVASGTGLAEDLYTPVNFLSVPSTVYSVAVKAKVRKLDAGARTLNLRMKSGAMTVSGSTVDQSAPVAVDWMSSYFDTDPNTGVAWVGSDLAAAKIGFKLGNP